MLATQTIQFVAQTTLIQQESKYHQQLPEVRIYFKKLKFKSYSLGYIACNTEYRDQATAFYLLYHPNLYWIPTNSTEMMRYNNTLTIVSGRNVKFFYGRVQLSDRTTIGKVYLVKFTHGQGLMDFIIFLRFTVVIIPMDAGIQFQGRRLPFIVDIPFQLATKICSFKKKKIFFKVLYFDF